MTDNLHTFVNLPTFGLLHLCGNDAEAFAQSQFANDVLALEPGQWQWNCWLTAKGRVKSVFALLRPQAGKLVMVLPEGQAQDIGTELQRYVFRRKVTLALDPSPVIGSFAAPQVASGNRLGMLDDSAMELDMGSPALPRTLVVAATGPSPLPDGSQAWQEADLQLGLPRLAPGSEPQWTAQQLGLDRLPAVSVRKGCYPGQEIVARTHFLGKAKRTCTLLQLSCPAQPGTAVTAEGMEIGQLASTAGHLALAVLPLDLPAVPLEVNGQPAVLRDLDPGLAR